MEDSCQYMHVHVMLLTMCVVCCECTCQGVHSVKPSGVLQCVQVGDRCTECEDDHIDVLMDRPLSFAPFDPKRRSENQWAPYVNAKDGYRGFSDPGYIRGQGAAPESVGTWVADWQFVPCSWNHQKCANLMSSMGYKNVWAPKMTSGIDSFSLRSMANLRVAPSFANKKPWSG